MFRRGVYIELLLWLAFSGQVLLAQVTTAAISGTARDETGAVLPGVSVTIKNLDTGITRTVVTDEEGRYHAPNLALGDYEVQAQLSGFKTEIRRGVKLTIGREAVVDFTLKVGEMVEKIEVVGEAPLVETTSPVVANLVDDRQIRELPINLRSFEQFALLQPGVTRVQSPTRDMFSSWASTIAIMGARPSQNSFLLDGTDINQPYWNRTPGSVSGALIGVEAVREFNVVRENYSAEWGRSAGGVINAVTRSGTNELHGSAYEFLRNSALDARNFFDLPRKEAEKRGLPEIPPFKRNQFGFTLGGPVAREKTFFFANYEGLRERLGITDVVNVPNLLARQGILPDPRTGRLEAVPVHQAAKVWLERFHLPNGRDFGNGLAEHIGFRVQRAREDYFMIRIDHHFSEKDSFFARYTFDDSKLSIPRNKWLNLPGFLEVDKSRNQYLAIEEKRIFTPNLLNVFRFAFNRNNNFGDEVVPPVPREFSFKPGDPLGSLFVLDMAPIAAETLARALLLPILRISNVFQFQDEVSHERGPHSIKAGLNIERIQMNDTTPLHIHGTYIFGNIRSFVQGSPIAFQGARPGEDDDYRGYRQSLFGFYVQDNYKLRPNFTLNLGLRYEFVTVPTEANGKIANVRDLLRDRAVTVGDPFFLNPTLKNFAPRIGFAWDPFGDSKMAIRAGFGVFHDPFLEHIWGLVTRLNPPFYIVRQAIFPPFPNALEVAGPLPRPSPMVFDPQQPTLYRWSLNVQRELLPDTVFTIGYSGSRGVHLGTSSDKNTPIPQIRPDGKKFFPPGAPRRNPAFTTMRTYDTNASSWYHALELGMNRRLSRGFQAQVSYTFSRALDEASGQNGSEQLNTSNFTVMDPDDVGRDKGLSAFHIKHNFVANFLYELPFGPDRRWGGNLAGLAGKLVGGWAVNSIITVTSGFPVNLVLGINRANNGQSGTDIADRPDLRAGFARSKIVRGGPDKYYDPNAFALPEFGTFGNLARNFLLGPGLVSFDFSVIKNIYVGERKSIQFRSEFFNLFNRANFGVPHRTVFADASGVPSPLAGRIQSTITTSRQIQFGLKLMF